MKMVLVCSECGVGFLKPSAKGPAPARCPECKKARRRKRGAEAERARQDRRRLGMYQCGRCGQTKPGEDFATSQRKDGNWCRQCFRDTYVERSGGMVTRGCKICGSPFAATRRSNRVYCGNACKVRAAAMRDAARLLESKRGRACENCGGEIPPEKMANARYCSDACRKAHVGASIRRRCLLKTRYGMTAEDFDAMLAAQGGGCAICQGDDPGTKGVWHVDHCHNSGRVRGLLCSRCNTGLGQFVDRPDVLRRAALYLEDNL